MMQLQKLGLAGAALAAALFAAPAAQAMTKIERVVSPGGIEAWLVREPSVPLIAMEFSFKGGANQDPSDRPGVSYMTAAALDEGTPKELIKRHVKPHVFDITKPLPKNLPIEEQEDVGDSVLFYVEDGATFRKKLPEDATYLHRPANLEDVFLKLTGRDLRD